MKSTRMEMIGSAAAGIAHDINNQLNLIVNHLSLPDVEGAQRATERCSALTASLLAYCKGDPTELTSIDPAVFLRNFVSQLRLPASVDLHLHAPSLLPTIIADPLALTRALTNLISNAVDAMDAKGTLQGTLRITASPRMIAVSDSGSGVSPELAKQIFNPFFTTKGAHGTGLGLSIVRELMRQQGGSVTLHSEPGQGARFTLHFR